MEESTGVVLFKVQCKCFSAGGRQFRKLMRIGLFASSDVYWLHIVLLHAFLYSNCLSAVGEGMHEGALREY